MARTSVAAKTVAKMEAIVKVVGGPFTIPPVVMIEVPHLNPAPYNPRKMAPFKFESLKRNIRDNGFVENLVVQKLSRAYGPLTIVGGHQRVRAVREICVEENVHVPPLPCVVLDIDDRKARMLNVAMNNIDGEFDAKLVGELLETVQHEAPVLPEEKLFMGFEEEDFSKYLKMSDPPRIDDGAEPIVGKATLLLEFKDKKTRDAVKERLEERAKLSRKANGDVVLELFGPAKKKR